MIDRLRQLRLKPKTVFLVDSLGALITALLLFGILRTFNEYVGMPRETLTFLSMIALLFCVYSIICYFILNNNWKLFLGIIIIANLLYCCLTIGLVIYHYPTITIYGVIYFLAEIILVVGLVFFELKTLRGQRAGPESSDPAPIS